MPEPRVATYSHFLDGNDTIDTGIAIYFKSPESFTGEDILELQGHGGPVVLDMLLNKVLSLGARLAEPGEFSKRAFLNDKIDLLQAEAIADLINSRTKASAMGAVRSLRGEFSALVHKLVQMVINLRVFIEASLDFPEEELDFLSDVRLKNQMGEALLALDSVLEETNQGTLLVEGANVVLMGRPNAGKSSLMNLLTGKNTSIVTNIPGTTRDAVNETLQLDGIPLKLVDTAGIRESKDPIEAEGVKRAMSAKQDADLVIAVVDSTDPDKMLDAESLRNDDKTIVVFNKIDLVIEQRDLNSEIRISAKTGEGLQTLKDQLKKRLGLSAKVGAGFSARTRHVSSLVKSREALVKAQGLLITHREGELVAEELRICQQNLSDITGEYTADDLLGEIFSSFCIGK